MESNPSNLKKQSVQALGILNGRVYLEGNFIFANLYIKGEKISCITTEKLECSKEVDAKGYLVLPGFIDPHVHFHLGVGEHISSDDFWEGSKKGALGGITTYLDFLDPVKEAGQIAEAFEKRSSLAKKSLTDFSFHTTIANPTDSPLEILQASKQLGISSVKLFTTYSNTDRKTNDRYIYELLKHSKKENCKIVVHAENDELISEREEILVKDHEWARPVISETTEVLKLAEMAKETKGNLYIVHVSAGSSVAELVKHYAMELHQKHILLESCPHYFLFNSEVYEREEGYRYTMTPPLRPEKDRKLLGEYIDYIDTIGTDHCPFPIEDKKHEFTKDISMGIGGIQYSFLNMYSIYQEKIIEKFTKGPAMAYGLYPKKGTLLPGADADIVLFDENAETKVCEEESVYNKRTLQGAIRAVYLRGKRIVSEGEVFEATGNYVRRCWDAQN